MTHVGTRVEHWRNQKGMSRFALGEKSGLSHTYIKKLEEDTEVSPTLRTLYSIADALEIPISFLLADEDELEMSPEAAEVAAIVEGMNDEGRKMVKDLVGAMARNFFPANRAFERVPA